MLGGSGGGGGAERALLLYLQIHRKGSKTMSTDSRIAALEHLAAELLKEAKRQGLDVDRVFEKATSSLLGSDGPGGPAQKSEAVDSLKEIQRQVQR